MKSTTLLSLALLAVGTNANIFPTEPVATTVWAGGQNVKIQWKDDGKAPPLSALNNLTVELMTGSDTQQTSVDVIAKGVKGSDGTLDYTVKKTIGPPGQYFVRFNQDATFVWSTRFQINGISGPAAPSSDASSSSAYGYPSSPAAVTTIPTTNPTTTGGTQKAPTPAASATSSSNPSSNPKAAASSGSSSAAAPAVTTPVPPSSEATDILPSSLMSLTIGFVALVFTYLY